MEIDLGKDRLGEAKDRLDAKIAEMVGEMAGEPNHPKETSEEEQETQGEMPAASADMEDETMPEETNRKVSNQGTRGTTEIHIGIPDRPRTDRGRSDPDEMEDDVNKVRKFNSEIEEEENDMSIPGSPDDQPYTKFRKLDDEMLDSMSEADRKFLAAAILRVDITEVYSPERVAKVAQESGLRAGSSFDVTNGWDFNLEGHRKKALANI